MITALVISNMVLWLLVIGLSLLVFALTRQVGVLHERVAPAGALLPTTGPRVGESTEAMELNDLAGASVTVGGPVASQMPQLVLFVSPTCPVCRTLVPTAVALARRERLELLFASDGAAPEQHQRYSRELGIEAFPYLISQPLGVAYAVSKLPFALLIGADGVLASKGLVNTREHLESLVESMETGVRTLQEYMGASDALSDPVAYSHAHSDEQPDRQERTV